jgi:hypothetical protein
MPRRSRLIVAGGAAAASVDSGLRRQARKDAARGVCGFGRDRCGCPLLECVALRTAGAAVGNVPSPLTDPHCLLENLGMVSVLLLNLGQSEKLGNTSE